MARWRAVQAKVPPPALRARVEEKGESVGSGVKCANIRSFVEVADGARPGQIVQPCHAAMPLWDDVISLVGLDAEPLMHEAIFAVPVRPFLHLFAQSLRHTLLRH